MGNDLAADGVTDPDLPKQTMTPRRAPAELGKIRLHQLHHAGRAIEPVDRPSALQRRIFDALCVGGTTWERAKVS